jgi:hypothetical protein
MREGYGCKWKVGVIMIFLFSVGCLLAEGARVMAENHIIE